ncbi:hypothetical protein FQR65_LT15155 [Abscondita terminalis]|nr:hypothetical protein FQR65_LT15139 [Abscondita terminalis]KAF5279920.1 hypothetical protein FQR65_LT15155 [Abscondita terminalis]
MAQAITPVICNLGKTIGKLFFAHDVGYIQGICNTTIKSSKEAVNFIGQGGVIKSINELLPADITLITTPDDQIELCCQQLAKNLNLKKDSIVLHCSGSLSSDVLKIIKEKNCFIASAHPMRSFAKPDISFKQYAGTYCAIEGDNEAVNIIKELFTKIGSVVYSIDKEKKSSYHASGVFASNYLVTLCQNSLLCLKDAGVESEISMKIIASLMQSTLNNLETTLSPEKSLTGPIKRGDINTITKHLNALPEPLADLYKTLGLATLDIANLPGDKEKKIAELLSQKEEPRFSHKL